MSGAEDGLQRLQSVFRAEPHLAGQLGQAGERAKVVLQPVEVLARFPVGDAYQVRGVAPDHHVVWLIRARRALKNSRNRWLRLEALVQVAAVIRARKP